MAGDDGDEQRTDQNRKNRKGLQRSMVVVMAGDDGGEQRTERSERTEQKGFAAVDVLRLRRSEHTRTRFHPHSSSS